MPPSRGLLLADALAQAAHEGRKTQSRRPLVPQPPAGKTVAPCHWSGMGWAYCPDLGDGRVGTCECDNPVRCPWGAVGDLIYVRECWGIPGGLNAGRAAQYVSYRAGRTTLHVHTETGAKSPTSAYTQPSRWRPSIHMPKWAARTWGRLTEVRVEKLDAITGDDVTAEGVLVPTVPSEKPGYNKPLIQVADAKLPASAPMPSDYLGRGDHDFPAIQRAYFAAAWDRQYGKKPGFAWKDAPWVWVLSWEPTEAPV